MTYTTGYETEVDESEDLERAAEYLLMDNWNALREDVLMADGHYCNILEDIEKCAGQGWITTACELVGDLRHRAQELAYEHANPSDTRRRDEEAKADSMIGRLDFGSPA